MTVLDSMLDELEKVAESRVEAYQQETQQSCSAACLKAVLKYWGKDLPEELIRRVIGVNEQGAEVTDIVRAARELGFLSRDFQFRSVEQAKRFLDSGIPIIADMQSWNHPGHGHYVVIVSIEGDKVQIMDPNTPGNWRTLSLEELEERWWDYPLKGPEVAIPKWGAVVKPKEVMWS